MFIDTETPTRSRFQDEYLRPDSESFVELDIVMATGNVHVRSGSYHFKHTPTVALWFFAPCAAARLGMYGLPCCRASCITSSNPPPLDSLE
jgi:hypothetical protein